MFLQPKQFDRRSANTGPRSPGAPLAKSRDLRQAFEFALDRSLIKHVVFGGSHRPNCFPFPEQSAYFAATKGLPCHLKANVAAEKAVDNGVDTTEVVHAFGDRVCFLEVGEVTDYGRRAAVEEVARGREAVSVDDDVMAVLDECLRGRAAETVWGAGDEDTCQESASRSTPSRARSRRCLVSRLRRVVAGRRGRLRRRGARARPRRSALRCPGGRSR